LPGAQIDYNDGWVGRYQAQRVELLGVAAVPAISWQATDKLSLGFLGLLPRGVRCG
jgi:long-chain fatty acid transport protein